MLNFSDELDKRPAPTIMASLGMFAITLGKFTGFWVFYGLAGWLWVTSLQMIIWRAVKALKDND